MRPRNFRLVFCIYLAVLTVICPLFYILQFYYYEEEKSVMFLKPDGSLITTQYDVLDIEIKFFTIYTFGTYFAVFPKLIRKNGRFIKNKSIAEWSFLLAVSTLWLQIFFNCTYQESCFHFTSPLSLATLVVSILFVIMLTIYGLFYYWNITPINHGESKPLLKNVDRINHINV